VPKTELQQALARMAPEQLAVIQAVHETGRSLTVQSTAGSDKSIVLRTVAQVLPAGLRIGAFVLNKSIARSLEDALPSDVQVSTFHPVELVRVGDRAQAIYEFTRADAEGLNRAQDTLNALPLRLIVTFRCPRSHVALASEFRDLIVAADGAAEGEVSSVSEDELLRELQPADLVMAWTNAPMISLALRCAQQGLNVEVMGMTSWRN
jgi:hypothetical protein